MFIGTAVSIMPPNINIAYFLNWHSVVSIIGITLAIAVVLVIFIFILHHRLLNRRSYRKQDARVNQALLDDTPTRSSVQLVQRSASVREPDIFRRGIPTSQTKTRLLSAGEFYDEREYLEGRRYSRDDQEYVTVDYTDKEAPRISYISVTQPFVRNEQQREGKQYSANRNKNTSQQKDLDDPCSYLNKSEKLNETNGLNNKLNNSNKISDILSAKQNKLDEVNIPRDARPPVEGSDSEITPYQTRRPYIYNNSNPHKQLHVAPKHQSNKPTDNLTINSTEFPCNNLKLQHISPNSPRNALNPVDGQSPESVWEPPSTTDSSSVSGLSPDRACLFPGDRTLSIGTISSTAGQLEYVDDGQFTLEGSYFEMDPRAYTLTWAQSPNKLRATKTRDTEHL